MNRIAALLIIGAICIFSAPAARADFLLTSQALWQVVDNNGVFKSQATSGSGIFHESYDTATLSADAKRVYIFENDLGTITIDSWDVFTGAYRGAVGPIYPFPSFPPQPQSWPYGIQPNYGSGAAHTRSIFPSFGGDLLYIGPLGIDSRGYFVDKPVVNVVNTTTHPFVEQIVPPASVRYICDFAIGPGALGPKSRVYLKTNAGLFAFNETELTPFVGFDPNTFQPIIENHFQLASPTPLIPTTPNIIGITDFDVGPVDGLLYVLDTSGNQSSVKRYNTTTGALVDTFLTFEPFSTSNVFTRILTFGPDGGLFISFHVPIFVPNSPGARKLVISRFDVSTGQRTADYDLGRQFEVIDFSVLPVPEPSSLVPLIFGLPFLMRRTRLC
jgi:hypothetical protein